MGKSLRICFLGNFSVDFSSETHHAKSLGALGHQVTCLQETQAHAGQLQRAADAADLFIWVHTHGWHTPGAEQAFARIIERHKIPIITYHLDLWKGLKREQDMKSDPYWRVLTDFFTCDPQMADYLCMETRIRGHYLPAGVFHHECYFAEPRNPFDVCFVGSRRYHPEWPYRGQLIDFLWKTYNSRFKLYGQDGLRVVRGEALNQTYADARVVVGDTLCIGFDYPGYWSDRVYETLGRGGFLIHPKVPGMEEHFTDKEHLVYYDYGNFDQLKSLIDHYLANPEERERIRKAGHELVVSRDTYVHRWDSILKTLGLQQ